MQGSKLKLCVNDRVGLLSDVTQIFRETVVSIAHASVTTRDDKSVCVFYVTDVSSGPVDMEVEKHLRGRGIPVELELPGSEQQNLTSTLTGSTLEGYLSFFQLPVEASLEAALR